jgi:hypothetical protein
VQICHSIPLSRPQKDALAEFLTHLHSTTFLTPTLFVNVRYTRPEPDGDFYLAGKPRQPNAPNRILAMVRTGPTRPKEKYDQMAVKIQHKWYEVVNDPNIAVKLGNMTEREERRHKKLHFVVFHPMIAAVENGAIISGVSHESSCHLYIMRVLAYFGPNLYLLPPDITGCHS